MAVNKEKNIGDASRKASRANKNEYSCYEVDKDFVFCNGYTSADVVREWRFGKKTDVLYIHSTEEVAIETRRWDERAHKRHQRENKCRFGGSRCNSSHCESCPLFFSDRKGGAPISLEELYETNEYEPEDTMAVASPEKELLNSELWSTLFSFLNSLSAEERVLAEGIVNETPDKVLMKELGITHQSTLSSRKMAVKRKMQEAMNDYH